MKKAIVIGGTSGIGLELSKILLSKGMKVGVAGRNKKKLDEINKKFGDKVITSLIDITKISKSIIQLKKLINKLGGLDIIVISSAVSHHNPTLDWKLEKETVETNVLGFIAIANTATDFFKKQGSGHIVGISSIAALKHSSRSTAYSASKAFISNYMTGIRENFRKDKLNIIVTDVLPGFVDTPMIKGRKNLFWTQHPKKVASQIYDAIRKKKKIVVVTRRWNLIVWLMKILPFSIKRRIF